MTAHLISGVSPLRAAGSLFFSRTRYLDMAASHALALCLERSQYQEAHKKGEFPNSIWESETKRSLAVGAEQLTQSLRNSFLATSAFVAAALLFAMLFGHFASNRPIDVGKALSLVGAFLVGWAALFELGGYLGTYSGEQLHEILHPFLFRFIFLPGLAFAALGQVW